MYVIPFLFTARLFAVKSERCNKFCIGSLLWPKINPRIINYYIISDTGNSEAVNVNGDSYDEYFCSASSNICPIKGHPQEKH